MALGFEFAIDWNIYEDHDISHKYNSARHMLKKAAVLYSAPSGWQMTADGNEIEFVVNQIEENHQGEGNVRTRLRGLQGFIGTLTNPNLVKHMEYLRNKDLLGTTIKSSTNFVINTKNRFNITANPQATAGIRLGRIRKLFRILSNENSNAAKQFNGSQEGTRRFISKRYKAISLHHNQIRDANWPKLQPSPNLRGLATLVSFYIVQGKGKQGVGAVKYLFGVLARTSFAAMFKQLEPEEIKYYQTDPNRWVSFICNDIVPKIPEMSRVDPSRKLIERPIRERDPASTKEVTTSIPITVEQWLKGMVTGVDLLSAAAHPITGRKATAQNKQLYTDSRGYGHRLRGTAGLGDKMDVVTYQNADENVPVFEFRNKQRYIGVDSWSDYGVAVYRFIHALNTGNRQSALDLNFTG